MSGAVPKVKVVELGDVCQFLSGGTPSKERDDYWGGNIPWVTARDLKTSFLERTGIYLTSLGASGLKRAPAGAILVLVRGMTLFKDVPITILSQPMCFNQDIKALIVDERLSSRYLAYQLIARKAQIQRLVDSAGHGTGRLNTDLLKSLPLKFPSFVEQEKVASFFGSVDEKLDILRQKATELRTFKAGLMQKLFSQEIRFTRDDGSEFPDWEERRLGEIGIFLKGKGVSKADISEGGNLPCIRYGEIYTRYGERITEVSSATNVPAGDLVLSQARDVIIPASGETPIDMARACCVLMSGVAIGGDINVFRGEMNGEFLAYFLTNGRRQEIAQMAQGNSVVHLYPSQLRKIMISIPHPDEQRKIADALTALDTKITAVQSQITEMEAFKKGLLQQMFV